MKSEKSTLSVLFYLKKDKANVSNTVHKTFKFMKPFLRSAVNDGIIAKSPFDQYSVKRESTNRDYLTIDELQKLEEELVKYRNDHIIHPPSVLYITFHSITQQWYR